MSGARPDSEAARRGGLVPFAASSNGRNSSNNGSGNNSSGYPNISSNKSGNFAGHPAPGNVKTSGKGGNDQLWSNGSGAYTQSSAPVWPDNQQGAPAAPMNPSNSFNNRQTAGPGPVGGRGYIQASQPVNGPGPGQQQQQQSNWQEPQGGFTNVQQRVPVHPGNNSQRNQAGSGHVEGAPAGNGSQQQSNWQGPQGGFITQGPQKNSVPKGDYVYYDGNGNQIQPGPPPPGATGSGHWTGTGSDRHFHHHYYYNQQQQPAPVGYPYDKKLEEKKKRKPGAKALAAALITCWACTCCCHAPCGW